MIISFAGHSSVSSHDDVKQIVKEQIQKKEKRDNKYM